MNERVNIYFYIWNYSPTEKCPVKTEYEIYDIVIQSRETTIRKPWFKNLLDELENEHYSKFETEDFRPVEYGFEHVEWTKDPPSETVYVHKYDIVSKWRKRKFVKAKRSYFKTNVRGEYLDVG